ncbi:hypothetical protein ACLB2K_059124 [Fragaria x ananassa]
MALQCLLGSYSSSSLPPNPTPKTPKPPPKSSISSHLSTAPDNDDDEKTEKPNFDFLKLSVTLTVISASLPQTPTSRAAVKDKKPRASKKSSASKKSEALSPQELQSWSQGLPVVSNRIPYTQLLELSRESKLKHVIKPPGIELRQKAELVLVVLEDSRVLRTVLPPAEADRRFWEEWEKLSLESLCVNAYTPPVKPPEVPLPYLSFLAKMPAVVAWLTRTRKPAKKESKRAAELRQAREAFKMQRKEELERMRSEREMIDRAMKAQKKEEERRLRREARKKKHDESLREARRNYLEMANVWANLAQDSNVATALGLVFFYIFYRTVVFSYRRQKKDYEDRLKIEQAEAEERK